MSKLFFDYNGINNEIIPSINETLIKLNNALFICNNIVAPSDASLSSILSDTKKELNNNITELKKIKEWLEKSSRIYKNRISSMENSISNSAINKIIKKENWIKEITHEE